jgi:hypothetical protein
MAGYLKNNVLKGLIYGSEIYLSLLYICEKWFESDIFTTRKISKMKIFFFLLLWIALDANGQSGLKYDTKIGKANKVEIKDGIVTIKKADTVIITIYSAQNTKSEIFLTDISEHRNDQGLLITDLTFYNEHLVEYVDVDLKLVFDAPVEDVKWGGFPKAEIMQVGNTSDKKQWHMSALKVLGKDGIKATITSKKRPKIQIFGIKSVG